MDTIFNSKNDKDEFSKAFEDILILFGKNNISLIADGFKKRLGYVKSHPNGFSNDKVNNIEPGKSGYIGGDINGKMFLEFINSSNNQLSNHYMRHEMVHIFETVAHDVLSNGEKGTINSFGIPEVRTRQINGNEYAAINGTIYRKMRDNESGNVIHGGGFCELFTDMMAVISKVNSDEKYKQQIISADMVISHPIEDWNIEGITTGYMKLFPLARLMIAAFANSPDVNYQKLIESGNGIFFETNGINGKRKIVNDFIYGSMCDPFYIMSECDKIAGRTGYYFSLCNKVDKIVNDCAYNHNINIDEINNVINELTTISALRIRIKVANGELTPKEGINILEEFDRTKASAKQEFNNILNNGISL